MAAELEEFRQQQREEAAKAELESEGEGEAGQERDGAPSSADGAAGGEEGTEEGEVAMEVDEPAKGSQVSQEAVALPARSRWLDDESDEEEGEGQAKELPREDSMPALATREDGGPATAVTPSRAGGGDAAGAAEGMPELGEPPSAPPSRPWSERQPNVEGAQTERHVNDEARGGMGAAGAGGPATFRACTMTSFTGEPLKISGSCRSVERFEKLYKIDEGTYGVVYKAKDRATGDIVALKQVKLLNTREGFPVTALREINVLLSLSHPNIVNVREMVVGNTHEKIFMVMDFMEHDLKGLMHAMKQPFSASEVKRIMLDLVDALAYCHEHWVLHRDLKTSNLLMNNKGMVCICDFGLARKYGDPLKEYTNMVVTLWYRAPELLLGDSIYGPALDVWSLGCIFAELVLMTPLLPGQGEIDQIDKIFKLIGTPSERNWPGSSQLPHMKKFNFKAQPFNNLRDKFKAQLGASFTSAPCLSECGLDLLTKMLALDPKQRISAVEALSHDYFKEQPAAKEHCLMPSWPSTHDKKRKGKSKSLNEEEEQQRLAFYQRDV